MRKPRICATIVDDDIDIVRQVEPLVDLFEVRIDLIGDRWQAVAAQINKPWIACNRMAEEGGRWDESEARRVERLLLAAEMGASIVDIELRSKNIENLVPAIKKRSGCLVSSHDLEKTPEIDEIRSIITRQHQVGADICKVVTMARSVDDNWTLLQAISEFRNVQVVSFAMGPLGTLSRILSPLTGGYFTYASMKSGKESAQGQVTVKDLTKLYEMVELG
jgi:3-dehydroquinate dehydratase type I